MRTPSIFNFAEWSPLCVVLFSQKHWQRSFAECRNFSTCFSCSVHSIGWKALQHGQKTNNFFRLIKSSYIESVIASGSRSGWQMPHFLIPLQAHCCCCFWICVEELSISSSLFDYFNKFSLKLCYNYFKLENDAYSHGCIAAECLTCAYIVQVNKTCLFQTFVNILTDFTKAIKFNYNLFLLIKHILFQVRNYIYWSSKEIVYTELENQHF